MGGSDSPREFWIEITHFTVSSKERIKKLILSISLLVLFVFFYPIPKRHCAGVYMNGEHTNLEYLAVP